MKKSAAFDRDAILDGMAPIIAGQIALEDTDAPVFHGCVDWHSAVHGHWALLRIARTTGKHGEKAEAVNASLDPKKLEEEMAGLRSAPDFEMPYGRAWFLLLAEEFERWAGEQKKEDPKRLRAMADEVAKSLLSWFSKRRIDPDTPEYGNQSWAILRLSGWYAFTGDPDGLAQTGPLALALSDPKFKMGSFADDAKRPEFFSRFGNWVTVIATTQPRSALDAFLRSHRIFHVHLTPVVPGSAAHCLGMNWSRAWAFKALAAATGEDRFTEAFEAHVLQGMRDHAAKKGDKWAYDHWVPQFAVYALTEAEEPPGK